MSDSLALDEALDLISKPYEYEPLKIREVASNGLKSVVNRVSKAGELVDMQSFQKPMPDRITDGVKFGWKVAHVTCTVMGALSFLYFGLSIYSPQKLLNGSLDEFDTNERMLISQIGNVCFNKLPFLNQPPTCKMYINEEVGLVSGYYRDYKPFQDQAKQADQEQLAENLERRGVSRHKEMAGMAKPVDHP